MNGPGARPVFASMGPRGAGPRPTSSAPSRRGPAACALGAAALAVCTAGCPKHAKLNEHPDVPACRAAATSTASVPLWTGGAIAVRFANEAAPTCPAPGRIFVDAAAGKGLRFIQVVDVDVPAPDKDAPGAPLTLVRAPHRWVFLDVAPEVRKDNAPFVNGSDDGTFWDNPAWLDAAKEDQRWAARSYAVVAHGTEVDAVGGFTWGFTRHAGETAATAVAPAPLDAAAWRADRALLEKAFSSWSFE